MSERGNGGHYAAVRTVLVLNTAKSIWNVLTGTKLHVQVLAIKTDAQILQNVLMSVMKPGQCTLATVFLVT